MGFTWQPDRRALSERGTPRHTEDGAGTPPRSLSALSSGGGLRRLLLGSRCAAASAPSPGVSPPLLSALTRGEGEGPDGSSMPICVSPTPPFVSALVPAGDLLGAWPHADRIIPVGASALTERDDVRPDGKATPDASVFPSGIQSLSVSALSEAAVQPAGASKGSPAARSGSADPMAAASLSALSEGDTARGTDERRQPLPESLPGVRGFLSPTPGANPSPSLSASLPPFVPRRRAHLFGSVRAW